MKETYRSYGDECPVCKDLTGCCEHVCQVCDKWVLGGTCPRGHCEEHCDAKCERGH